jgi:hypothetical protein
VRFSFRAKQETIAWLRVESKKRGVSVNELMNLLVAEARKGIFTVYDDEGSPKTIVPRRWWEDDKHAESES